MDKQNKRLLNAQVLKRGILKKENIPNDLIDDYSYQTHHIIPNEIVEKFCDQISDDKEKKKIKKSFDQEWNGMMFPTYEGDVIHRGSHEEYNKLIDDILFSLDINDTDDFIYASYYVARAIVKIYEKSNIPHGTNMSLNDFSDIFIKPQQEDIISDINTMLVDRRCLIV